MDIFLIKINFLNTQIERKVLIGNGGKYIHEIIIIIIYSPYPFCVRVLQDIIHGSIKFLIINPNPKKIFFLKSC